MITRHLTLTEYQPSPPVRLSPAQRDALQRLIPGLAITPSPGRAGRYYLTPGSWVGIVQLGSMVVEIRPKLPVEHVLFLLSYAADPHAWRAGSEEAPALERGATLAEAVVWLFVQQVRRAVRRGLLQGYCTREAALPGVRGRLRFEAQVREHFGLFPPAEVRHDELTEDIELNRLLKAALLRLERLPPRTPGCRHALRRLAARFTHVSTVEYDPRAVPEVAFTRLEAHYRPAVQLARLILRSSSVEARAGSVPAVSLLVDMSRVFEDFVVVALRQALGLTEQSFPQGAAGRTLVLDRAGAVRLEPDLSWWEGSRCCFVGDVKYKRAREGEHADLYQVLAYAVAADLPCGLLVYAAGEADPASHEVVYAGKLLQVVALDLAGPPPAILAQIELLAQRVRRLRRLPGDGRQSTSRA